MWIQSVVMLAALKLPLAVKPGPIDAVLRLLLTYVAPVSCSWRSWWSAPEHSATAVSSTARRGGAPESGGGALSG